MGLRQIGVRASDSDLRRLARLAELLENDAVQLGFLGPNEGRRVVPRHLLESAALGPCLASGGPVVDVGSGAGLPGLVLAALGHDVVMIEAISKRADFLRYVSAEMNIDTDVRHARAEDEGRGPLRDAAGSVVARALAAPDVAMELCLPFARPGGRLLLLTTPASEAPNDDPGGRTAGSSPDPSEHRTRPPPARGAERSRGTLEGHDQIGRTRASSPAIPTDRQLSAVASMLGGSEIRWQALSVPGVSDPRWVMMVDKREPTPERFPRRPGVPKRRPLGGSVASVN